MSKSNSLSTNTSISLGLAASFFGALVMGGVFYGITTTQTANQNQRIDALTSSVDELTKTLNDTRERQIRTEATSAQIVDTLSDIKSDINIIKQYKGLK